MHLSLVLPVFVTLTQLTTAQTTDTVTTTITVGATTPTTLSTATSTDTTTITVIDFHEDCHNYRPGGGRQRGQVWRIRRPDWR
ncbi:hypothetical protein VTH82DRAFT_8393 [Thermothelomyces myriococcoides]